MRLFTLISLLLVPASIAGAQRALEPAAVVRSRVNAQTVATTTRSPDSLSVRRFAPRLLLGIGGAAGGLLVGALAGPAIFGRDCGGCDDPGLSQAVAGATIGAVVGASVLSAGPVLGSHCGYAGRLGLAALGSVVGGVIGVLASGQTEVVILTFPLGIGTGAALGSAIC